MGVIKQLPERCTLRNCHISSVPLCVSSLVVVTCYISLNPRCGENIDILKVAPGLKSDYESTESARMFVVCFRVLVYGVLFGVNLMARDTTF